MARAVVEATANFQDAAIVAKVLLDVILMLNPGCGLRPITLPGPKAPSAPQRSPSFC